ncbi:MAG: glycosyltransferase [Candidatus Eremiobacteraeota bacterium]|nr:glycosyltransferase [Candidatus Eremiobacteraeota bacterium]
MKVAFVHDYLTQLGGAERVLLEMHRLFPAAPIFTSLYDPRRCGDAFAHLDVRTTWLQRVPYAARFFRALLPLYPAAFESLDLSGYELVISSTTSFAKGVRVKPGTLHVAYVNTPTRFVWRAPGYAFDVMPAIARPAFVAIGPALRRWDLAAAKRPHRIIANSRNVAERVRRIYGRQSDVLACPVDVADFAPAPQTDGYYLVVARLLPYKRVNLAIEACNALGVPLIVVGAGPQERSLRKLAGRTVYFAGRVDDRARRRLFAGAEAVIVPGIEDFGLVPVEAAAAGRPTVAFAAGGALETVIEGKTGVFFREPTARSLAAAIEDVASRSFSQAELVGHAALFAPQRFRAALAALLQRYLQEFGSAGQAVSGELKTPAASCA